MDNFIFELTKTKLLTYNTCNKEKYMMLPNIFPVNSFCFLPSFHLLFFLFSVYLFFYLPSMLHSPFFISPIYPFFIYIITLSTFIASTSFLLPTYHPLFLQFNQHFILTYACFKCLLFNWSELTKNET